MPSYAAVAVVVAVGAAWLHLSARLDLHRVVYNHRPGVCRQVHGVVHGSEGVELVREKNVAFVSSGVIAPKDKAPGGIFLYDFDQSLAGERLEAVPVPVFVQSRRAESKDFRPHGLSHWLIDGVVRLYVIVHNDDLSQHSVQFFDFDEKRRVLNHVRTIRNEAMISPNDIVAVGPDQFVFSNDGAASAHVLLAEHVFSMNAGSVYSFDGEAFSCLLPSQPSPNGVAFDAKRDVLYVAMIINETVNAYDLAKDKRSTRLLGSVRVHSACDNLQVADDGSVWTACHPLLYQLPTAFSKCESRTDGFSASQVLRLAFNEERNDAEVTEIYANDGLEISSSSQAIRHKNQLLIGSVCRTLLHCAIADPSVTL